MDIMRLHQSNILIMEHLPLEYHDGHDIIYMTYTDKDSYKINQLVMKENFMFFFMFEKGNGMHTIGSRNHLIKAKTVHIVLSGQKQTMIYSEPAVVYLIMLSKDKYEQMMGGVEIPTIVCQEYPVVDISREVFNILSKECNDIEVEISEESPVMQQIIYFKIMIILRNIGREVRRTCRDYTVYEKHPILFTFIILIRRHLKENRSVSFYAKLLGLTSNYLNVLCKKHLNKTASKVIDLEIIPVLKREITASDDLLVNIAYDYGFESYLQFSRFFKNYVRISPMAYRRKNGSGK